MMIVLFHYNNDIFEIKSKKEDKMKDICNIFKKEIKLLNVNLYYLCGENEINEDLTLSEQIIESDISINNINIFVFDRDNIISIIYKIKGNDKIIRIFGETFVNNNKNICKIFCRNIIYELTEYICIENNKSDFLEIKLIGIREVKNMKGLFNNCTSLYCLPDISEWKTDKVIDMSFLFYGCVSLYQSQSDIINGHLNELNKLLESSKIIEKNNNTEINLLDNYPHAIGKNSNKEKYLSPKYQKSFYDISKWNTKNVTDISFLFAGCESLILLPDISEWNIEKVTTISGIFADCTSIEKSPDISKMDNKLMVLV